MQVADVMSYQPVMIGAFETTQEAAERMRACVVGVLPVLENGHLVGIITDRDLAVRVVARRHEPTEVYVREVMTPHPASCHPDDALEAALAQMLDRHVRRLVVVNGKEEVIGLLSVDDLAADERTQALALLVLRGSMPARDEIDGELAEQT